GAIHPSAQLKPHHENLERHEKHEKDDMVAPIVRDSFIEVPVASASTTRRRGTLRTESSTTQTALGDARRLIEAKLRRRGQTARGPRSGRGPRRSPDATRRASRAPAPRPA